MSLNVKLSLAERFLNWFPNNTKLYIRGQRGKDWNTQRALDEELAEQLREFFDKYGVTQMQDRVYAGRRGPEAKNYGDALAEAQAEIERLEAEMQAQQEELRLAYYFIDCGERSR